MDNCEVDYVDRVVRTTGRWMENDHGGHVQCRRSGDVPGRIALNTRREAWSRGGGQWWQIVVSALVGVGICVWNEWAGLAVAAAAAIGLVVHLGFSGIRKEFFGTPEKKID